MFTVRIELSASAEPVPTLWARCIESFGVWYKGRLGGVAGLMLNAGLCACTPLQLLLFSTCFAKYLDTAIKGESVLFCC